MSVLLLSSSVCKSALHWGAEIRTCCYSFRQQARVSYPGVPAREFYSLGRFLKLLIMLKLVVREASTGDDVHLITDHAVLCPILHSLCW